MTIVIILSPQLLRCSLCKDSNIRSFDENEFCSVILTALRPNYIPLLLENLSKMIEELLSISASPFQYTINYLEKLLFCIIEFYFSFNREKRTFNYLEKLLKFFFLG